ncbi:uncharacterized protein LOC120329666 [Styela clava]
MKINIDKEFMGSTTGILRLGTIGFGGAVFGTLAANNLLVRPTAHLLMWIAVFAWSISTIIFIAGLLSRQLFSGGAEYRVSFLFSILYLIGAIMYGIWDIDVRPFTGMGVLVFVYAAINFILYLVLFALQFCSSDVGRKWKESAKTRKEAKPKKEKKSANDDKKELKEEIQAEEGTAVNADAVVENGKDDEPEAQQAQQEAVVEQKVE